jgi:DNA-binding transcriptional LysR family regulator
MPTVLVYDDIVAGSLVDIFPDQVAKKLGIYAVYPYTKHVPKKIQRLIEHIRAKYHSIIHVF